MSKVTKEDFIVQNITLGHHYVSDLKLSFGPLEVIDLTYKDVQEVKGSQDLRNSLRAGLLRKITREKAEEVSIRRTAQMRKDVTKLQKSSTTEKLEIDGRTLDVEPLNLNVADNNKMSQQVSTAGYANDPLSYAVALELAQAKAEALGQSLSVEDFASQVTDNPDIVRRLILENTNAIKDVAEESSRSAAYFATGADENGRAVIERHSVSTPPTVNMSDRINDAEAIDLTKED